MKAKILTALLAAAPTLAQAECQAIAGMTLCGDFAADGAGWHVSGDASLAALGQTYALPNADLSVSIDPPAIAGEVDFAMPAIGPLAGWTSLFMPRAEFQMGLGAGLDEIEIGGQPLALEPDQPYLHYSVDQNVTGRLGEARVTLSNGGSTTVVLAPMDPLIYLEGGIVDALTAGVVSDGAVGVSLGGNLPWASDLELTNARNTQTRTVSAHLMAQGNVQLGQYPVYVMSQVALDLDVNDDGQFAGIGGEAANDFKLGANGELALGWDKGPVSLTLPIGDGSLVYNGANGKLMVAGELGLNPYAGTPLEPLFFGVQGGRASAYYEAPDDFSVEIEIDGPVMGFPTSEASMSLSPEQVSFAGRFEPQYGDAFGEQSVEFSGRLTNSGQFRLEGQATLNLAGFELANAELVWRNSGLSVSGAMDIPGVGAGVQVQGSLQADGQFSLSGSADFAPAGLQMSQTVVTVSNQGVSISGRVTAPAIGQVQVSGVVLANGQFELTGVADLNVLGISLADAAVTVSNQGVAVRGEVKVPGLSAIEVAGDIEADGDFRFTGEANLRIKGFDLANAEVTLSNAGLSIEGRIDAIIAEGRISGGYYTVQSRAAQTGMSIEQFEHFQLIHAIHGLPFPFPTGLQLSGSMDIRVPVINKSLTEGRVYVRDSGVSAKGKVSFFGNRIRVSGKVAKKSNGSLDLEMKGSVDFDMTVAGTGVKGELEVTLTENSLSGRAEGKACVNVVFDKVCKSAGANVSSSGNIRLNMPSPVPDLSFNVDKIF